MLAITFAVRQVKADAFAGLRLGVADVQPGQLIAAKPSPETDQHQGEGASMAHQRLVIAALPGSVGLVLQPGDRLLKVTQQQRRRLFGLRRMHDADAFEQLPYGGRFGRVRESLGDVPLGEGRQTLLQRADGVLVRVLGEITHDAIARGGQVTAPGHFEMLDRGPIAATCVGSGAC